MTDIYPCPKCECSAEYRYPDIIDLDHVVACCNPKCGIALHGATKAAAIEKWNSLPRSEAAKMVAGSASRGARNDHRSSIMAIDERLNQADASEAVRGIIMNLQGKKERDQEVNQAVIQILVCIDKLDFQT